MRIPPIFPLTLLILGVTFATARSAASELETFHNCEFEPTDWADGDSFAVRFPDGKSRVLRLYYVDCIETTVSTSSDKRRLREQSRYFGVEDIREVIDYGKQASRFTADALAEPFTVHTAFANAHGRSGKPRYFAFVRTSKGKDLGRLLVESGLARAHGVGRETPSGTSRDEWEAYLADLELSAAIERQGVWKESNPKALIALRKAERDERIALEAIDDAFMTRPPSEPVDLNTASLEDLMRCGLRESLADAAVQLRPFRSVDDLIEVKGIGPVTLRKVRPYLKVTPESSEESE